MPLALLDFLNSREDAAVIWAAVILAFVLYQGGGSIRGSFWLVIQTLFPKLFFLFAAATFYGAGVVYAAWRTGLWHTAALKETLYALFAGCFVLVGRAIQERAGGVRHLRKLLGHALRITIIVEFVMNLYVLPLAAEVILLPVMVTLLVTQDADKYDLSKRKAARLADNAIAYIGVAALTYVVFRAATALDGLVTRENAEGLLVGPALPTAFLPFAYVISWWSSREQENLRKRFQTKWARLEETSPKKPRVHEDRARALS
jgi:hypothetical protein